VVFLGQEVTALGDDESTVVGTVGQEVDEALETTEAWSFRVLVLFGLSVMLSHIWRRTYLVRPRLSNKVSQILSAFGGRLSVSTLILRRKTNLLGKRNVDGVEGHDQVIRTIDLFESANDSGLLPELPNGVLVTYTVVLDHCNTYGQKT
jgi:uncharacterized membrane protein